MLYKAMVRPHVEYANSIWFRYKNGDIEAIEKVQKRATKLVISLKKLPYTERLLQLNLHTLKYRRLRGDMISSSYHIRFWYLWCCGCPGLRGRQHLATPHTRSP